MRSPLHLSKTLHAQFSGRDSISALFAVPHPIIGSSGIPYFETHDVGRSFEVAPLYLFSGPSPCLVFLKIYFRENKF